MDLNFNNNIALISGSGQGIGLGIAESLLQEGAHVALVDKNKSALDKAVKKLTDKGFQDKLFFYYGDFAMEENIKECIKEVLKKWKSIDILVVNIGTGRSKAGWDVDDSEWKRMFEINLFAGIKLCRAVIPHMIKQNKGVITFTASIAGVEAIPAPIPYSAAKAALIATSKNMAKELACYNIRVNAVAPGNVFFKNGTWDIKMKENKNKVKKYIKDNVPLNRFASIQEIGDLVAYLSSDKASFITGSCLIIDGCQSNIFH